jgi:surface protein
MKTSINTTRALGQFKTSIDKGIYEGNTPHISEWRTTTSNETVTLPYQTNGIYNGIIDWGDGTQSVNSYVNRTHTYASAGYYIITVYGRLRIFRFNNAGDKTKLYRVFQWGSQFDVGVGGGHFYGCTNLDLSIVSDVLILYRPFVISNTQNFNSMFRDCVSLTTINRFDEWDTSNIIFMESCFRNATLFNQDIGDINISNVTNFTNFMLGKTFSDFSTTNYDALLIGWASGPVQPGININFGTIKRTVASLIAYATLTVVNGWTITDGGI